MLPISTRRFGLSQVTAADGIPSEASVAKGGGAPNRETEAMPEAREVVQDEKNDVEVEAEEKEALSSDAQAVDREAFPSTFDDLCHQMAERAKFLLEVIFDTHNFESISSFTAKLLLWARPAAQRPCISMDTRVASFHPLLHPQPLVDCVCSTSLCSVADSCHLRRFNLLVRLPKARRLSCSIWQRRYRIFQRHPLGSCSLACFDGVPRTAVTSDGKG